MTSLNPVYTVGDQIVEAMRVHDPAHAATGTATARDRRARAGGHPGAGAALRRLSAPALRRHAPARDDRDGAGLLARPADRRRADHGARRDRAGADPGPAARAPARDRHGHPPHHARPRRGRGDGRRGGGDVRRPGRRARAGGRLFDDPQHPYTLGLLGSMPRLEEEREPAAGHRRQPCRRRAQLPAGCRFHPRCVFGTDACTARRTRRCSRCGPRHGAPASMRRWSSTARSARPGQAA